MIVIKITEPMLYSVYQDWYTEFLEQMDNGLVMLPPGFDYEVVDDDTTDTGS